VNIGEAHDWNALLAYLAGTRRITVTEDKARDAAMRLADRAHKALNAGPTGADVAKVWDEIPKPLHLARATEPACRVCGCTEYQACPGGCAWAEGDLCTACVTPPAAIHGPDDPCVMDASGRCTGDRAEHAAAHAGTCPVPCCTSPGDPAVAGLLGGVR
jgi:hypothetical protein